MNLPERSYPTPKAGHYLCTIAAVGHAKLVKPLRYGVRHGTLILVNRQLLVANAFENLIEERVPRFHSFVRGIYDRFGIPLYRLIENVWLSDAVYILMKPLEYFFLICLYLLDEQPEKRIKLQYPEPRGGVSTPNA